MAKGKSVEIATRSFNNRSLAVAFFREMMGRYQAGDKVSEEDALDLIALLERHPDARAKTGIGVDHLKVERNVYGTNGFYIVRPDGSGPDFSYMTCIKGELPSRKQQVSRAFRWAVRIDLYRARDKFFAEHKDSEGLVTCAVTRERIGVEEGHMDHRSPMTFDVIVTTFLVGRGVGIDDVPIVSGQDNQQVPEIADGGLIEAFREFHHRIARLDFVHRRINLAQSARERLRPSRIMPGSV
jgi:hypothetical protein